MNMQTCRWLGLLLGLLAAAGARAEYTVTVGYGGVVNGERAVPIHVTGLPATGETRVRLTLGSQSVETLAHGRECWLYWRSERGWRTAVLTVTEPSGRVTEQAVEWQPRSIKLLAGLAAAPNSTLRPSLLRYLSDGHTLLGCMAAGGELDADELLRLVDVRDLPDQSAGLEPLDTLILETAPRLSVDQLAALAAWVRRGGHLVLLNALGGLNDSPVTLGDGERALTADDDAALARAYHDPAARVRGSRCAQARLAPGATLVAGSPTRPLVATREVGAGRVVWLATAGGGPDLWLDALGVLRAPTDPTSIPGWFHELEQHLPGVQPPGAVTVCGFALVYLLTTALLLLWLARRLGRPERVWLLAPVLVAAFCLAANALATHHWGRRLVAQTGTVVTLREGDRRGQALSRTVVLSPRRQRLNVELPPAASLINDGEDVVQRGAQSWLRQALLYRWEPRELNYEYPLDLGGTLEVVAAVQRDGRNVRVRLTNTLGWRVEQAVLFHQHHWAELGRLEAGATCEKLVSAWWDGDVRVHLAGLDISAADPALASPHPLLVRAWFERPSCPVRCGVPLLGREVVQLDVLCEPTLAEGPLALDCETRRVLGSSFNALVLPQPLGQRTLDGLNVACECDLPDLRVWRAETASWEDRAGDPVSGYQHFDGRRFLAGHSALVLQQGGVRGVAYVGR